MNYDKILKIYKFGLTVGGAVCFLFALYHLAVEAVGWEFLLVLAFAAVIVPRLSLTLPRSNLTITFSDSLIFFTFLVYNGHAAIVLAALEMLAACYYVRKRRIDVSWSMFLTNISIVTISTSATFLFWKLNPAINQIQQDQLTTRNLIIVLGMLACFHFFVNWTLFIVFQALRKKENLWTFWKKQSFSSSLSYLVGTVLAGFVFKLYFYGDWMITAIAFLSTGIVYISFSLSISEINNANAQAEQAEREKAEVERERRIEAEKLNDQLKVSLEKEEGANAALRESQKAFQHSALHDPMTDLANRQQFVDILRTLIHDHKQDPSTSFHVLFLDISRFKNVNDTYGHTVGDKILILIARRFLRNFRFDDTIARLGGDEFAIILRGLLSVQKALKVARKIHQSVSQPFSLGGNRIFISLNIGVAPCDTEYETPEEVLRDADIAMHYAREKGTGVAIFTKELRERFLERVKLENDLRFAVERKELRMHYQPLVSLSDGSIIGFEALVRWKHKELGLIPPNKFIPIAEESGLIIPMTIWILGETCQRLAEWQKISPIYRDLIMSVNISGKHLANDELVDEIEEVLDTYNIAPHTLKLEITESVAMENAEQTIEILNNLKQIGVQLSIDDFGTGYSSLNYLHRLPFDSLKIDRSFVYSVSEDGENSGILQTIILLAKNLKMKVIAEGIETETQLMLLRDLGCDYGQGYLLAKPQPHEQAEQLLYQNSHWLPTGAKIDYAAPPGDSAVDQQHIF